jgi:hypothetical protein
MAPFQFRAYEENIFPTPVYFAWEGNYSVADVGDSFFAPPDVVNGATAALRSPTAIFDLQSGAFGFSQRRLNEVPWGVENCSGPNHTCVFVDDPSDYFVTSIERTIDMLAITAASTSTYHIQGAQTIRLFGEHIPEPRTAALVILAASSCIVIRSGFRKPTRSIEELLASRPQTG